ncbi:coatomer subunit beta'-1 [Cyclospora cayetanensis]|uniref:Coatomer subunit beta' n=1 Tax=Cyclospora cayetanensis TaxID=88456 RepID=A0A6P6RX24_9EIME|nr:coatomer subunit beta'-1 [Cyclospora cayetanensis]
MALGSRLTRHFFARSERVKGVDLHPSEPLLVCALYDGHLKVYNYSSLQLLAELDASPLPLRTAAFIPRRDWVACAGDDCTIRCFSLNTQEKLHELPNAHKDYIRHLAVHPSKGLALSSSDDMTIKLWDVDENWSRLCSFEGHAHYVMQTAWSPRDLTLFASCSLDRSIRVWGIGSVVGAGKASSGGGGSSTAVVTNAHFSLLGHERGVNAIAYSTSGERPYLVSGADDATVRVWDYQTKQCIQVLRGHSKNVCAVLYPCGGPHALPVMFSGGEDGKLCVWHSLTYKEEAGMDLALDRIWTLSARPPGGAAEGGLGGLVVAVGSDAGTLVLKMGKDGAVVSSHGGKAVVARGFELLQLNLKLLDEPFADGEKVQCPAKEIGNSDIFPQSLSHHPNGRFLAVIGDGEYVIYTAQALRSKAFGPCEAFCWSLENHYAVLEKGNRVKIYCNFEEAYNFTPPFAVEELFGGFLLGLRSDDSISFYDWTSYRLIRKIEVFPTAVYWAPNGMHVAIVARLDRLYILRHDKFAVMAANTAQALEEEGGIPIAFELVHQANESVSSGLWLSDCFLYITRNCRLRCYCGCRIQTLHTLEARELRILAVIPEQNRIFLISPSHALYVYSLNQASIQYQVAVARGDLESAKAIFPQLPVEAYDEAARALQAHGYAEEALEVARDEQLRFELALAIGALSLLAVHLHAVFNFPHMQLSLAILWKLLLLSQCAELIRSSTSAPAVQRQRWAAVGDAALQKGYFSLAAAAFWECKDYPSLLLMYSSSGDVEHLRQLGEAAAAARQQQIAFVCFLLTHQLGDCVKLLLTAGRAPEAALFARTYCPSAIEDVVKAWREARTDAAEATAAAAAAATHTDTKTSSKTNKEGVEQKRVILAFGKVAQFAERATAVQLPAFPFERPEAFPKLELAKQAESVLSEFYCRQVPGSSYLKVQDLLEADILQTIEEGGSEAVSNGFVYCCF